MTKVTRRENSLNHPVAAAPATPQPSAGNGSSAETKRSLRSARTHTPIASPQTEAGPSRLRRISLRNISSTKSDDALPGSSPLPISFYSTPDLSDASKHSRKNVAEHTPRIIIKSSSSKLPSPTTKTATKKPIIYDTIEVMFGPPPEFLVKKAAPALKRSNSKINSRRSKRRKIKDENEKDASANGDLFISQEPIADVEVSENENSGTSVDTHEDGITPVAEPQTESYLKHVDDIILEDGHDNNDSIHTDMEPNSFHEAIEAEELNREPTPVNLVGQDAAVPYLPASPIIETTPEPMPVPVPTSVASSAHKSHHSVDINEWLMTDVEQSAEPERIPYEDGPQSPAASPHKGLITAVADLQDGEHPQELSHIDREEVTEIELTEEEVASPAAELPALSYDEKVADDKLVNEMLAAETIVDESMENQEAEAEAVELETLSHSPDLLNESAPANLTDSPTDTRYVSATSSVYQSPSPEPDISVSLQPPERPESPKPVFRAPLDSSALRTSPPRRESSHPPGFGRRDIPETVEGLFPRFRGSSAPPKHPYASPNSTRGETPNMPSRLPTRQSTRLRLETRQFSASYGEMSSSGNPSHISTVSSTASPVPQMTQSPSPTTRAVSPSFGLHTTPRPISRPPSRPARGLRHVNHDVDARSKLLMARPRISIPSHIPPSQYARECIEAATFCRLPPYNLDPAEHKLLRTHINHVQVTTYLNVRNGILRLWMLNPTIAVCLEEALGVAKEERHLEMAAKCHEFLVRNGYINFGCIPPPKPLLEPTAGKKANTGKRRKRIIVIGAGAAGLGCARQLENLFVHFADRFPRDEELPEVVVLEGRDRIGGRIYSCPLTPQHSSRRQETPFRSGSRKASSSYTSTRETLQTNPDQAVDMGAQIVTGFDNGNPLAPIVKRQLQLRWHHLHDDSLLFNDEDGFRVDDMEDVRAEKLFNDILDRASSFKEKIREPTLIEGDRELIDQGKEPHGDSGRTIAKVEENEAIIPPMPPSPPLSSMHDSPVSRSPTRPWSRQNQPKHRVPPRKTLIKMGFEIKSDNPRPKSRDLQQMVNYTTLGQTMKSILVDIQGLVDLTPMDLKLINWHWANLEYGNATNLKNISLKHWDQDDGNEFLGAHAMIIGGYGQFATGLAFNPTPLAIGFQKAVREIRYSNRKEGPSKDCPVLIKCRDGETLTADAVVVTVSLGVLKSKNMMFEPELPERKLGAISRLGFGLLNKVVLVYDYPFWDVNADFIGCLRSPSRGNPLDQDSYERERGRFYLIWNCTPSCGRPTLVALMAGDAAHDAEIESDNDLVKEMTTILSRIHGSQRLPLPVETLVSRWGRDPFIRGSYSFVGPDATGDDYDILGEPVDKQLFFAGEATCRTHPATVHGAYMSGLRAASQVLESLIGKIEMPADDVLIPKKNQPVRNPLVERSGIPEVKRRTDPESHRYKARNLKRAKFSKIVDECAERILSELGPKPAPPKKYYPNAFLLFQKDKWDIAREKANKARHGDNAESVDSASRDEVRAWMGRMWRDLPEDEKRWYNDEVEKEKVQYKEEMANFGKRIQAWEQGVVKIKDEVKRKMEEVYMTEEEREMIAAAKEEERLEQAAREERENLRKFYEDIGMDDLLSDFDDESSSEDPYLQNDDAVLDQMLKKLYL